MRRFKKNKNKKILKKRRAKVKRKEYNSGSLPEACSCGSAASDTSGREGRKEERQNDRKKDRVVS